MAATEQRTSLRLSFNRNVLEVDRIGAAETPATMFDLFVSGYDEVKFEADEFDPEKQVLSAKMKETRDKEKDTLDNQEEQDVVLGLYIPDPPCILPYEDDEAFDASAMDQENATVQNYWKNYASFLDEWPGVKERRQNMDKFITLWSNRPTGSRLRAYVVVTNNSVGVRYIASGDDDQKNGQILRPGQCVAIEAINEDYDREEGNRRYLKLPGPGAGWVFESRDGVQCLAEIKAVETGTWWYRVQGTTPAETRKSPAVNEGARTGWMLAPKEVVMVNVRCKLNGFRFLHLADGRGWIFEQKPGTLKNDKNKENLVLVACEDEFLDGESAALKNLLPPTHEVVEVGLWTYVVDTEPILAIGAKRNGIFIKPGDVVKVDKRANSSGNPQGMGGPGVQNRRWLRLGGGRGWVPETDEKGKTLLTEQFSDEVTYPAWFKPNVDPNTPKEEWHIGTV